MDELFDQEEPSELKINSLEGEEEPGDRNATADTATDDGIGMGILPNFTVEKDMKVMMDEKVKSLYIWIGCRSQAGHWHLGRWSRRIASWRWRQKSRT